MTEIVLPPAVIPARKIDILHLWIPLLLSLLMFAGLVALILRDGWEKSRWLIVIAGTGDSSGVDWIETGSTLGRELRIDEPTGVTVDLHGNIFFTDRGNKRILKVDPRDRVSLVAESKETSFDRDSRRSGYSGFRLPNDLSVDRSDNLFVADAELHRICKVSPDGHVSTVAGTGYPGAADAYHNAFLAQLNMPLDVSVDAKGNLYIADMKNNRIVRVTPGRRFETVAGTGKAGNSGDGGPATRAKLNAPECAVVDMNGNLFIADTGNDTVRKVDPRGIITTVAGGGRPGLWGMLRNLVTHGDGGPARTARFSHPHDLALDAAGDLFIADQNHNSIREILPDGTIRSVLHRLRRIRLDFWNPDTRPHNETLHYPRGIALDARGNLYVADWQNDQVYELKGVGAPGLIAGQPMTGGE